MLQLVGLAASVAYLVLAFYNLIMVAVKREKTYFVRFLKHGMLFVVLFFVAGVLCVPPIPRSRDQGRLTACKSNLKNIGTALEMYSTDFEGRYPPALSYLTPNYLRVLPECPAARADTYTATYRMSAPKVRPTPAATPAATPATPQTTPETPTPGAATPGTPTPVPFSGDAYTFYCSGSHHAKAGVKANYPQYNSHEGLIEGRDY